MSNVTSQRKKTAEILLQNAHISTVFYPGEMTGEKPVGIETFENKDEPYWPSGNNSTYKEVWLTPAGRRLTIVIELYPRI